MTDINPRVWKDIKAEENQEERDWQAYEELEHKKYTEANPYPQGKLTKGRPSQPFHRICFRCKKKFLPTGKYQYACEECRKKARGFRRYDGA